MSRRRGRGAGKRSPKGLKQGRIQVDEAAQARLDELAAIYRHAKERFAGSRCEGSTECCRFAITGREPYVTSIEVLAVRRALARRGGALRPKKRALPLVPAGEDERTCPMLDERGRCCVYADRPLGCRTFWCHRAEHDDAAVSQSELNELVRRVQEVAAAHETRGDQGRPLTRAFADLM